MSLFRKQSIWQRAAKPVTSQVDVKSASKSGLVAVAGAIGVTAASAVISSIRRKDTA